MTIGRNTFRRDADGCAIHVEIDDLVGDFTQRAEVPPWRPETGHVFFGEQRSTTSHGCPLSIASPAGADRIAFTGGDIVSHRETAVPVANRLDYRVDDGDAEIRAPA